MCMSVYKYMKVCMCVYIRVLKEAKKKHSKRKRDAQTQRWRQIEINEERGRQRARATHIYIYTYVDIIASYTCQMFSTGPLEPFWGRRSAVGASHGNQVCSDRLLMLSHESASLEGLNCDVQTTTSRLLCGSCLCSSTLQSRRRKQVTTKEELHRSLKLLQLPHLKGLIVRLAGPIIRI